MTFGGGILLVRCIVAASLHMQPLKANCVSHRLRRATGLEFQPGPKAGREELHKNVARENCAQRLLDVPRCPGHFKKKQKKGQAGSLARQHRTKDLPQWIRPLSDNLPQALPGTSKECAISWPVALCCTWRTKFLLHLWPAT